MKICKVCGKEANTDRLLCKECYRKQRSNHLGKEVPLGKEFIWYGKIYIVTEDCKVFSTITYRYLKPIIMKNGYVMFSFGSQAKGTRKQIYAHRLMGFCYGLIESLDSELEVDHIDGNRQHNLLPNLKACTHAENETNKNIRNKGTNYAHKDGKTFGPFYTVKDMYKALNIQGTIGSFYSQVSRGNGYGYVFTRENI